MSQPLKSLAPAFIQAIEVDYFPALVPVCPYFTAEPASVSVNAGVNATFSVTAAVLTDTAIAYQWQVSSDNGVSWTNLVNGASYSGVTTSTLTVLSPQAVQSGNLFRVSIESNDCSVESSNATLTVQSTVGASALLVGGGAAGRMGGSLSGNGGGGSGGQVLPVPSLTLNLALTYPVVVGLGGIGTRAGQGGSDGGATTFDVYTAAGGARGGGQNPYSPPNQGPYGGGGGWLAGSHPGATGLIANAGGASQPAVPHTGGGGGGAGGNGQDGAVNGNGGLAVFSSISGASLPYGAGGGGGSDSARGIGGSGVGGNGASEFPNFVATPGAANTGSGGGGGGSEGGGNPATLQGANGGDGVFILSYSGPPRFTGGTITSVGGNTIHTFTSSGNLVPL